MAYTKIALVTAPTLEPVSLTELKNWLRIDGDDEDSDLADKIRTARTHLEEISWRAFLTQTWDVYFDSFETEMVLPKAPIQSITSVKYYDTAGTQQTLASTYYELSDRWGVGFVREKYQQTWPAIRGHYDDVVVRVICGYGDTAATVPQPIRTAVKYLAAHFQAQREPVNVGNITTDLPFTIDALIDPYRIRDFAA